MIRKNGHKGFTYLELVVAMGVSAILAAITIPSYLTSVRKNNRTDGYSALAKVAANQELFFSNQAPPRAYTDDFDALSMDTVSSGGHYNLSVSACAGSTLASCYVITATARSTSTQYKDSGCTTLTLNSRGQRSSAPKTTGCWRE